MATTTPPAITITADQWNTIMHELLQSRQNQTVRPAKRKDPESFSGDRNKLPTFLAQCKLKFLNNPQFNTDNDKICYAISFLKDTAFQWIEPQLTEGQPPYQEWEAFEEALTASFGDPDPAETARTKLSYLRQLKSVAEYWTEFHGISLKTDFDNTALMHYFRRGLKRDIQERWTHLENEPETLEALKDWAIKTDNKIFAFKRESSRMNPLPYGRSGFSNVDRRVTTPMELDATRFTKLSNEEKEKRRRNNLCMYCGKGRHYSNNCPAKNNRGSFMAAETQDVEAEKDSSQQ
jgi:hypothetical protein